MKSFKSILVLSIAVAVLLSGCATSSPIERYSESESNFRNPPDLISHDFPDQNIYRIYHRASTGYVSIQSIRQAAEARAAQFAERQGKSFIVLGERISQPPYILGNFPRIEIVFALIDKDFSSTERSALSDRYEELRKAKALMDDGIITEEEFEREKDRILAE